MINLEILTKSFNNYLKEEKITEKDFFKEGHPDILAENISWFINNSNLEDLYSYYLVNLTGDYSYLFLFWNISINNERVNILLTNNFKLANNKEELFELILEYSKELKKYENK